MKTFIITTSFCFLFLLSTTTVFAQYKFFTGGTLQFSSSTTAYINSTVSNTNIYSYTILPHIGAAISDHMIIGLGLGYEGAIHAASNNNRINRYGFIINPFARYRVGLNNKMGLYGELGAIAQWTMTQNINPTKETSYTTNRFGAYLGPGIDYTFSDRWMVNVNWHVLEYSRNSNIDRAINALRLNFNPGSARISLNYLF